MQPPQGCDGRIDVAFGFQLGQDLVGELVVALLEGLAHALDAGLNAGRIEHLEGLVAGRLRRASANSRALEKRYHGCFAMALWMTRLIIPLTSGFSSEAGGGICFRMAVGQLRSACRVRRGAAA